MSTRDAAEPRSGEDADHSGAAAHPREVFVGVVYALGAALSYGASQVLTRQGVSELAPPLVGAFIAILWGVSGFALVSARGLTMRTPNFWRGARFVAAGGLFSAGAVLLMFQALSRGQVVVVAPILSTNPLFTLLMAALLLRGLEQITWRVVAGTMLVT
ncbi:MAG: DMT family transporter [Chloroflexi bacterium]|nr:DMT family transporter [Chloroflexota bacterium]